MLLSLEEDVLHEEFREVVSTTDFIYLIEGLIDICNSKNILSQHLKSPLQISNKHIWKPFLSKVIAYLLDLRNSKRKLIRDTNKKVPIVGFISFIVSLERIFDNLIATKEMRYLLTYKFSLNHLHVCLHRIYKCINSYGILSALEFKKAFASYIQEELKHLSDHTTALKTIVLERTETSINDESVYILDPVIFSEYRKLDIDYPNRKINRPYLQNIQSSCEYVDRICIDALVKDLCDLIVCPDCCSSVRGKNCILNNYSIKKTHKLYPSLDVLKICKQTKKVIKELLGNKRSILPKSYQVIETQVFNRLSIEELFNDLSMHVIDNTFPENHIYILIKTIIRQYIKISCVCKELHHQSLLICQ
ncbi:uncharacterized protein LOC111628716 [Centruroides sculpturatus]|uniref:uncharacterized protein LOC111628716 n=1 Tax=Centruroides sculpturatus TaxID=218467 RepID=UPI000C6EC322|nr:uncharacterized protein LOC111628716 [Centruroides sculpturatus]